MYFRSLGFLVAYLLSRGYFQKDQHANPEIFSAQALRTLVVPRVMANSSQIYTTNSYGMILVQKSPIYYGQTFVTFGYQLMLTLFVQLMGMGFAGYLRRFSVYPVKVRLTFLISPFQLECDS
jgi:hypothetical protein